MRGDPPALAALEAELAALGLDGAAANLRCLLSLPQAGTDRLRAALPRLDALLAGGTGSARPLALKGKVLSALGELAAARACLERSLAADARQPRALAWLGEVHLLELRFAESLAALDRALCLDPACPWALFFRAACLYALRRAPAAREDLERLVLVRAAPEAAAAAKAFLALLETEAGSWARAAALLGAAARAFPGEAWPLALRGRVARLAGRLEASERDLTAALGLSRAPWILAERASLNEARGRLGAASADLAAVLAREPRDCGLRLRLADLEARRGRRGAARRHFAAALDLEPQGAQARVHLFARAERLEGRDELADALALAEAFCGRFPGDLEARLLRAQLLKRSGRAQAARSLFAALAAGLKARSARKPSPDDRRLLARALYGQELYGRAEAEARRALAEEPASEGAACLLSEIILSQGRPAEAAAVLESRAAAGGASESLRAAARQARAEEEALARVALGREDWSEAEALARRALARAGRPELWRRVLAESLVRQGRPAEAEPLLRGLLAAEPAREELRALLCLCAAKAGRWEEAAREARRLGGRGGGGPWAAELGELLLAGGRPGEARRLLARAAGEGPGTADQPWRRRARAALVDSLSRLGRLGEARRRLASALRDDPGSPDLQAQAIAVLDRQGRLDECLALARGLKLPPSEEASLQEKLARVLLRRGRLDLAEECLGRLLEAQPRRFEARRLRGELLSQRALWPEAAAALAGACAVEPAHAGARLAWAEALLAQGDLRRGLRVLEEGRSLAAARGGTAPAQLLGRFKLAVGLARFAEAERLGERLLASGPRFSDIKSLARPAFLASDRAGDAGMPAAYRELFVRRLDAFVAARPDSPWGRYWRPVFFDKLKVASARYDWGQDVARLRRRARGRHAWMRFTSGHFLLLDRRFGEAIGELEAAAGAVAPGDWRSLCLAGEARLCLGRVEAGLADFDRALACAEGTDRGEAEAWRGEALLWLGRYEEALAALAAIPSESATPLSLCWQGGALVCLGRPAEALPLLDRALAALPHDCEARLWRAEALARLGGARRAEAWEETERLLASPQSPVAGFYVRVIRGLLCALNGDTVGAAAEARRVPPWVRALCLRRLGLPAAEGRRGTRRVFEGILKLSRGVRRGGYETAVWTR